jgi:lipoprotein-anchoring transpeptidase ErfK/SrfK
MARNRASIVAGSAPVVLTALGAWIASTAAFGQPFGYSPSFNPQQSLFDQVLSNNPQGTIVSQGELTPHLRRQVVPYQTREVSGTVIVDTANTRLFYVLGGGRAISYGIGVGRDGFTWSGVQSIARKAEWPDWIPPTEMLQRQPYLPRFMAGGPGNPLGARALYLGGTVYRIHGTNAPETIGNHVSSGCIRMLNEDVIDLYGRVSVGTKVVVLPDGARHRQSHASTSDSQSAAAARPFMIRNGMVRAFGLY